MTDPWDDLFTTVIADNHLFRVGDIKSTPSGLAENHLREIVKMVRKKDLPRWSRLKDVIQRVEWPLEIFVLDGRNEFDINFELLSDNTSSKKYVERMFIVFWIIRSYFISISWIQGKTGRCIPVPPYGWEPDYRCDYKDTLIMVRRVFEKTGDLEFKKILDELTVIAEQIDKSNKTPKCAEDKSVSYYISMMEERQEYIESHTVTDIYETLREQYSSIDSAFPGEKSVYKLYEMIELFFWKIADFPSKVQIADLSSKVQINNN